MTIGKRNSGFGQSGSGPFEEAPSLGCGNRPSGCLQNGEGARALCRRRFGRSLQPGIARIAAGPRCDIDRDKPGIFERGCKHARTTLAEIIVAAAAIDPADARLEANAAAETCRTQDRADDLGPERRRDHAAGDRGGGAAARSARRALGVPRIAGAARLGCGELRCHHFSEHHRPGFTQRSDAGRVASGAPAREQRRALLGRHVGGFDNILDAERHAVDRRQRPAVAPARGGIVGSDARRLDVVADKGADGRLEFRQTVKAAFEKRAGRVAAGGKISSGGKERHQLRQHHRFSP